MDERIREFVVTFEFIRSVCKLAQEQCRKVWKTLEKFARDPTNPGLNREALSGGAEGLCTIRVDDRFRIVFRAQEPPVLLFAGNHEEAYQFAQRGPSGWMALRSSVRPVEVESPAFERPLNARVGAPRDIVAKKSFFFLRDEVPPCAAIRPEQLRSLLLRTRRYLPITSLLSSRPAHEFSFEVTFHEIERLLGEPLPQSARRHRPWWANDPSHVQATAWLALGWKTRDVQMKGERLTFARIASK